MSTIIADKKTSVKGIGKGKGRRSEVLTRNDGLFCFKL